jgi:hypothetical protein
MEHSRTPDGCVTLAAVSLLTNLDAFSTEHRRCGDLDAGVGWPIVWIACRAGPAWRGGRTRTTPLPPTIDWSYRPGSLFENLRSVLPVVAELGRVAGLLTPGIDALIHIGDCSQATTSEPSARNSPPSVSMGSIWQGSAYAAASKG